MKKVICFDFDGVIVDGFFELLGIATEACGNFPSARVVKENDIRTIKQLTWFEIGRLMGLENPEAERYAEVVFEKFQTLDLDKIAFNDKMIPVLKTLAEKNLLFIITSSTRNYVHTLLEKHGCLQYFTEIFDGTDKKSKSQKLTAIKSQYAEFDIYMIGDSQSDIIQGNLAKAKTIAVNWGWQNIDLLLNHNPSFVADSPQDLLKILT